MLKRLEGEEFFDVFINLRLHGFGVAEMAAGAEGYELRTRLGSELSCTLVFTGFVIFCVEDEELFAVKATPSPRGLGTFVPKLYTFRIRRRMLKVLRSSKCSLLTPLKRGRGKKRDRTIEFIAA